MLTTELEDEDLNLAEVSDEETITIAELEDMTIKAKIVGTRSQGMLKLLFIGRDGETLFSTACHYCQLQSFEAVRAVEYPVQAATPKDLARAIYAALEAHCQSRRKARLEEEELER